MTLPTFKTVFLIQFQMLA